MTDRDEAAQTIGQKVKTFRERSGLNQLKLTLEAGLSPGTISKIENDKNIPTINTLHKIADALELTKKELSYLLGVSSYSPEEIKGFEEDGKQSKYI